MTTIAFVNCDTCDDGDRKAVPYTDITLVCNQDTEKWTYTYQCKDCGGRQVFSLDPLLVLTMQACGTETLVTKNPVLSHRPYGPPLDNTDLSSFRVSLNQHDYLAAYAEG